MTLNNTRENLKLTLETRQLNILMSLHSEWGSDEYQNAIWTVLELDYEDFDDFQEKYGSITKKSQINRDIFKVCCFFNGLGTLVHKEYANLEVVDELFGYMVIWVWQILEPIIVQERILWNQPKSLEGFEYLHTEFNNNKMK